MQPCTPISAYAQEQNVKGNYKMPLEKTRDGMTLPRRGGQAGTARRAKSKSSQNQVKIKSKSSQNQTRSWLARVLTLTLTLSHSHALLPPHKTRPRTDHVSGGRMRLARNRVNPQPQFQSQYLSLRYRNWLLAVPELMRATGSLP